MKKSWSYFTSAIIESGSFGQWSAQPISRAQGVYEELLSSTNCDSVDCMLALSTEEVFNAHVTSTESSKYLSPFVPTADGVEFTTHPWLSLNNGDVADVPVLQGTNADEGILFTALDQRRHVTESELIAYWRDTMDYSAADIKQLLDLYVTGKEDTYPETNHEGITSVYWWALQRSVGDNMFSCPAKHASTHLSASQKRKSETYVYHFEYTSLMSHYAVHGSELPYAFHWRLGMISNTEVADMISSYWGNFVLSDVHDPNIAMVDYNASSGDDTLPKWPVYTKTGDEVMVLADKASTASSSALKEEQCKFHIQSIEAEIRADFGH
jgi:carboxylesterase type B